MRITKYTNINQFTEKDVEKFKERFNQCKKTDKGCILWNEDLFNYNIFSGQNQQATGAHRFSYLLFNGPCKTHEIIRHKCDVPCCVNPDHLVAGTDSENGFDRSERNFIQYASEKLTQKAISKIITYKEQKMEDSMIIVKLRCHYRTPDYWSAFLLEAINSKLLGRTENLTLNH